MIYLVDVLIRAFRQSRYFRGRIIKTTLLQLACLTSIAIAPVAAVPPPQRDTREDLRKVRARLLVAPVPEYPGVLRRAGYTGSGLFELYFDTRGEVSGIRILKSTGHKELDIEALKGLVRWRARPGPKWQGIVPVTFSIGGHARIYSPIDRW